jgi:hypothetical protein
LIFKPDNFSMVPLTGAPWKSQTAVSHSSLGFISQTKIWMFNVSVPDSYTPVCHSSHELSVKGLGPLFQRKDIFNFTTLKGDCHLATKWCCMSNFKDINFMGSDVIRASAGNGSLISNLTKSSNLTGKNSYCVFAIGHH